MNEKLEIKEYDNILNLIMRNDKNYSVLGNFQNKEKLSDFKDMFLKSVKKSTFLANILPSITFLVISLISFCLLVIKDRNANLGFIISNENLRIAIMCFLIFFISLSIILCIRRWIFKIRVIEVKRYNKYGYMQISNKKYLEIINNINLYLNN